MNDPCIHLYSGKKFNLLNPNFDGITIDEIAHGLSHINRWTGQTKKPLSVCEHLCNCYDVAPEDQKLGCLTHDVPENFCNDMSKPLKNLCTEYQAIENNIEKSAADTFNFPYPHHPIVKIIDNSMMVTEGMQLIKNFERDKYPFQPFNIKIKCWSPKKAKREFLKRYYKLRPKEKKKHWFTIFCNKFIQ